ncbi:MAG TPA: aminomethyl-transferring glycine dehydrogenase subunit GcvPA [Acidimicrobiales bacterium]|nr:aminomethyl-transferring glycine dehydrogenase subunit GcvPA [Acidimicrobiales bacterium]
MGHFVPHTDAEIAEMLAWLGLSSLDELFAAVPAALRLASGKGLDLEPGLSEPDVLDRIDRLAAANRPSGPDLVCFAGAGAYDHDIPSVVGALAFRSEFVTAYTPYQPEVAQGVLQALFEYQTLVCRLTGMEVANASLYDGASACVEAINLSVAATGRPVVWVSRGVHPHWREVMATFAAGSGHRLRIVDLDDGRSAWPTPGEEGPPGVIVLQQPNFLGCLEDVDGAVAAARAMGAHVVVAADPVSLGLLKPPGDFGVDVVVGEGQPFGTPLSFGGPYLGLFACRRELVRRLPGRLVGETVDVEGRRAYVTTLRTREQDIRRGKASSNVCTNQTLIAVAFAVHLAWLGTAGLRELALRCARGARYARESLLAIGGIEPLAGAPVLREFALRLPVGADLVVERMAEEGFLAGVPLGDEFEGDDGGLLVAVTERRTRSQIDAYVAALDKVIR